MLQYLRVALKNSTGRHGTERRSRRQAGGVPRDAVGAGFDLREGGRIICGTIHEYEPGSLSEVRLIGYSDEEFETLVEVAKELRNGGA